MADARLQEWVESQVYSDKMAAALSVQRTASEELAAAGGEALGRAGAHLERSEWKEAADILEEYLRGRPSSYDMVTFWMNVIENQQRCFALRWVARALDLVTQELAPLDRAKALARLSRTGASYAAEAGRREGQVEAPAGLRMHGVALDLLRSLLCETLAHAGLGEASLVHDALREADVADARAAVGVSASAPAGSLASRGASSRTALSDLERTSVRARAWGAHHQRLGDAAQAHASYQRAFETSALDALTPSVRRALAERLCVTALAAPRVFDFAFVGALPEVAPALRLLCATLHEGSPLEARRALATHRAALAAVLDADALARKITIVALLDLAFAKLTANSKSASFTEIAEACQVPPAEVEPLVVAAMSSGVLSGTLDQSRLLIRDSLPRGVDDTRCAQLASQLDAWATKLDGLANHIQNGSSELLQASAL